MPAVGVWPTGYFTAPPTPLGEGGSNLKLFEDQFWAISRGLTNCKYQIIDSVTKYNKLKTLNSTKTRLRNDLEHLWLLSTFIVLYFVKEAQSESLIQISEIPIPQNSTFCGSGILLAPPPFLSWTCPYIKNGMKVKRWVMKILL